MQQIALDCGHGFSKGIGGKGRRLIWPSWIAPVDSRTETGTMVQTGIPEIVAWRDDPSQAYWVGPDAGRIATNLFSRDKANDRLTRDLTLIMAHHLTNPAISESITLAVGLPLSWYGAYHRTLAEALVGHGMVNRRALTIESVKVFPQGIAAVLRVLTPQSLPGLYGVIDIGYRTTEYVMVDLTSDHRPHLAQEPSGTWEIGMHQVNAALARQVLATWQVEYAPHELDRQSTITVRGESRSLAELRQPILDHWRDGLIARVQTAWGPILPRLQACIVIGGPAPLLEGQRIGTMPVTVPPEPQWANVEGYLTAATAH